MRKLLVSFATGMALILPTVSAAVGLGGIKVYTKLNQKLNAEIPILSVNNKNRKTLSVAMGSNSDFARRGLQKTAAVRKVNLNIVTKGGRSYVKVSSQQLINVPYLNFIVKLNSEEGVVSREYAVFLDPVGGVKSKMSSKPAAKSNQRAKVNSKKKLARSAAPNTAVSSYRGGKYGPIRRGETLWSIAKHVRPSESVSVRSMMNAIIRANPRVFPNRRANEMPSGVMLHIPTMKGYSPYSGGYAPIPNKTAVNTKASNKVVRPKPKTSSVSKVSKPVEKTVKKSKAAVRPPVSKAESNSSDLGSSSELGSAPDSEKKPSAMENVKNAVSEVAEDTAKGISDTAQNTSDAISKGVSSLGKATSDAVDSVKETTGDAIDAVKKGTENAVDKVKEVGSDVADGTKKTIDNVVDAVTPEKIETPEVKLSKPEVSVNETQVKVDLPKAEAPKVAVNTAKPKINTPKIKSPTVTVPATEETLIPGVPDIATYIGGGLGALGLVGGGLLLARRKKSSDLGKGVVLTDESDIEEFSTDDEVVFDEDLLPDDDEILVADDPDEMQVDDDLLLDLDDELDDDLDASLLTDESDDVVIDSTSDFDDEFDLDALDFDDDLEDDLADIGETKLVDDIDNGLDFDLDETDDLLTDDEAGLNDSLVDDDEFVFDLDDMSTDKDELSDALAEQKDDFEFTTAGDLDGLEDLSLDIADPDAPSEKLDDDFSFDLTDDADELTDINLDKDDELDLSDDLDIDFSEDFESDVEELTEVSKTSAEQLGDELSFDLDDENDFDFDDSVDLDSIDTTLDSVLDGDVDLTDDELDLDSIDTESELEDLLVDADEPIDLRPAELDVDKSDVTEWQDDASISFEEETSVSLDDLEDTSSVVETPTTPMMNASKAQMKLDLARSFISIGETSRASDLLKDVLEIGENAQIAEARSLLDSIS